MLCKILICSIFSLCFIKNYSYKLETLKDVVNEQHLLSSSSSHANCDCEHGDCELDSSGIYKCVCWPEFGRFSDTRCKECLCGPAANCTIEVGWFKDQISCICPKGVKKGEDKRCEDPCEPGVNPCKNEGNCSVDYNGVKCDCKHPYTGKFCEEKKSVCLENTCAHGGTCFEEENEPKCECRPNFSGPYCEDTPCSEKPCQNGGICQIVHHQFACFCKYPFYGIRCEKGETTSTPNLSSTITNDPTITSEQTSKVTDDIRETTYTQNLSSSISNDPTMTSELTSGITDDIRETTYTQNPSSSNSNDPTMTLELTSGVTDDITSDPCIPNPCKYDFKCRTKGNNFKCSCKLPYKGETCEITPCTKNPCENGATCTVVLMSAVCECQPGFHGDKCQKKIEISTEDEKSEGF